MRLFTALFPLIALAASAQTLPPLTFEKVAHVEERPVFVTHSGQPGRLFIIEQPGRIDLLENGKLLDTPYLDLTNQLATPGEGGLLGLAFHPQFATNGLFYINCTMENKNVPPVRFERDGRKFEQKPIMTVIGEYKVDPAAKTVDARSMRTVLTIDQPYENHNGGMIAFGPDGMLYIGMGDGGNQRDPHKNGQNLNVLLGKMLRIDVNAPPGGFADGKGYAIPKDNPFVGNPNADGAQPSARPEIWTYGMRNPWRWSFDRATGLLYAGDVGEDRWEEVDVLKKGGNYGWSEREGLYPFNRTPMAKGEQPPSDPPASRSRFAEPIKAYWHDKGQSITGGYVYRGKAIPELAGWYLYGDYAKGTIWALKYDPATAKLTGDETIKITNEKAVRPMLPSSFGEDVDGELYICSHQDGNIWKITRSTAK